jgi:hypothetical protein
MIFAFSGPHRPCADQEYRTMGLGLLGMKSVVMLARLALPSSFPPLRFHWKKRRGIAINPLIRDAAGEQRISGCTNISHKFQPVGPNVTLPGVTLQGPRGQRKKHQVCGLWVVPVW